MCEKDIIEYLASINSFVVCLRDSSKRQLDAKGTMPMDLNVAGEIFHRHSSLMIVGVIF